MVGQPSNICEVKRSTKGSQAQAARDRTERVNGVDRSESAPGAVGQRLPSEEVTEKGEDK